MFTRSLLNKALYGPCRTNANTEIKDVLSRDHVLQKGEWNENVQSSPWATSFAISFKVITVLRLSVLLRKNEQTNKRNLHQRSTSFILSSSISSTVSFCLLPVFVTQVLDFPSQIDSFFKEGNNNCSLSC